MIITGMNLKERATWLMLPEKESKNPCLLSRSCKLMMPLKRSCVTPQSVRKQFCRSVIFVSLLCRIYLILDSCVLRLLARTSYKLEVLTLVMKMVENAGWMDESKISFLAMLILVLSAILWNIVRVRFHERGTTMSSLKTWFKILFLVLSWEHVLYVPSLELVFTA